MRKGLDNHTPKKIGDLFSVYKTKFTPPQKTIEDMCFEIIHTHTPLHIKRESIMYTVGTRTIYINTASVIKSELRRFHEQILRELKSKLGNTHCPKTIV